uniref:NADH dehydrogenase subunit 6 n=1 Tax=Ostorhinchus fasciatus TaxID=1414479 RepID=UPI001D0041A2|nr:NADH dehydrogenase subunit 6 [Ostorhinchus fasciatus]YP_010389694.1 NADH dehydrogenase subunit 6 [Ostorhinchus pleuron]QVG62697.1 NADH dehydrogenase subunit 6 [Ostorhinchus fasciatus]UPT34468.1 NADH dehydrogenase subunit 6 [Ostorhinchus pleuron]
MLISVLLFLFGWVVGSIVVASNPSPYFGALGLVFVAGMGGSILLIHGVSYLCFVLLLVYLGGMLVVFAYTSAMAADPYPETLGSFGVLKVLMVYLVISFMACIFLWEGWVAESGDFALEGDMLGMSRGDIEGVAYMYSVGGWTLMVCGWALLLSLFVVMEVIRGPNRGALRAV